MKKIITACILATCVAMTSVCFATAPATSKGAAVEGKQMADQAKEMAYKGIVKRDESGAVLVTADKTYPLAGGDFDTIIGKEVNVVGKVVKEGDIEKLVVSKLKLEKQ